MNTIEATRAKQTISAPLNEELIYNLQQAIKVINAEYQQIDFEDQAFLNRVLSRTMEKLEVGEAILCQ